MELDIPYRLIVTIIVIAIIVGIVVQQLYSIPHFPRVPVSAEGFVPVNTSERLRTLPEAVVLLEFLDRAKGQAGQGQVEQGQGQAERAELELLLEKMAALVADVTSTDRVVNRTRHLPFETAHDRLVVGELCGMCLQQTISARDLDILFETWRTRGLLLLRKLCTAYHLSETDALFSEKQWTALWSKAYDIATTHCVKPLPALALGPRDATPFEPESLRDTRSYDYTYGGLSASGWNGVV
jgi:hypothetical protein